MRRLSLACLTLAATGGFTGCSTAPKAVPTTVAQVDLDRYLGRWYVISHVPYFLEKGKVASYDTYARRPDGKLVNNFTFRRGSFAAPETTWHGTAWVTDTTTQATWKVRFLWPLSTTYKIFLLDSDYTWAVVGTGDAGLLWVLARERQLSPTLYATIQAQMRTKGIDPARLVLVPQPEA